MRFSSSFIAALVVFFPLLVSAQLTEMPQANGTQPQSGMGQTMTILTGRVAAEGGSAPPEKATVILECADETRAHGYSDLKGNFSITIGVVDATPSTASSTALSQRESGVITNQDWANCELYSDLSGFRSERIRMMSAPGRGMVDVGTIVLHPLSQAQEFTVSATSLAAPEKAKKALEKGQEQGKKGKWAAASDYFKKAIAVYPRYALAWVELGRAQAQQNNFIDAQRSFHQAVTQDSGFLEAYAELARIALIQKQWKELSDVTARLVQSAPDYSPEFWFLNSAANYNLGNVKQAETSAERGLRLDSRHQIPQMEYLYGLILASKQQFKSAAEHVATYLKLSPHASDAQTARLVLADYQKKSADGEGR
jgi:tetratricopeptide (TPR) repeat protein